MQGNYHMKNIVWVFVIKISVVNLIHDLQTSW